MRPHLLDDEVLNAIRSAVLTNPWASMSIFSGWGWGVALAVPGDTMGRPTYRHMAALMDEYWWTCLFLTIATLQTWRLFKRTTIRLFPYELTLKAVAGTTWSFVAFACFLSQWPLAAAMADALAIAIASWIDMARCEPCRNCPVSGTGVCIDGCYLQRNTDDR
jgi:hypothetical protein